MGSCDTIRIVDAAANRASEGLRVVEDFVRFALDDGHLTSLLKQLRHDLAAALAHIPLTERLALRETQQDVGTTISTPAEAQRLDSWDVCQASCERVKQSLRSLEEFGKAISPAMSGDIEQLRYRWYTLERTLSMLHTSRSRLSATKLCVLIDGLETTEAFASLAHQLIEAGVDMLQLRDKGLPDRELVERGRTLQKIVREAPQPCLAIINDRADIAAAVNADGVHLGQDDLTVKAAREILGPHKLIGVSTHNIEQARAAVLDGANYLGVGPTFPSTTKTFIEFPGLDFLRQVSGEITLPTFAIGGIGVENLPEVLATGIRRVAVSGAVLNTQSPATVCAKLRHALVQ